MYCPFQHFVCLLQDNPCLWNKSAFNYSKKSVKTNILSELCGNLNDKSITTIKAKFHSLRTQYIRHQKKSNSDWKYYVNMDFLREADAEGTSISKEEWEDEEATFLIDFFKGMSSNLLYNNIVFYLKTIEYKPQVREIVLKYC